MKYNDIIQKVAKELDLPEKLVSSTYESYWRYIRETISALPLKNSLSEEEFKELKTNFNIPSIGKLSCSYSRYVGMKNKFIKFKGLKDVYNKKDKTTIQ